MFDVLRRNLFDQLSYVPGMDIASINKKDDGTLVIDLFLKIILLKTEVYWMGRPHSQ